MNTSFAHLLREHARVRPNSPALTFEDETWTFSQLHAKSSQAANAMLAAGVKAGDRVALLSKNCAECFLLLYACNKIGAIFTGLNWRLAPAEIEAIALDAQPALLVVSPQELALLTPVVKAMPCIRKTIVLGDDFKAWCDTHSAADTGYAGAPTDVALLLYTSGTTGLPKGVMLTNRNMSYTPRLASESWGMGPDSVNLVAMPMFHIGGCGYGSSTMTVGGHTVLIREVNPARIIALIEQYKVTHTFLVPTVVQSLLEVPGIQLSDLSSLSLLMYGAAPMGDVLLRRAMDILPCQFMQAYGMTETAGTVVVLPPEDHAPEGPGSSLLKSVGRALPWVELRVVDPATNQDTPVGEVGEIWLRTDMNTVGYWNKPDETAQTIQQGDWLRTGDAAYLDDKGYVFLFDRFKDLIISGGENISSIEVEDALYRHPAVLACAVVAKPDDKWGETPLAFVELHPGHEVDAEQLQAHCKSLLAGYKVPRTFVFEAIPKTSTGKIQKFQLREKAKAL
ncbi:MAG: long-chain-fatty-acid--CoA ligase [Betaproteobacteria bacterium]|nr:long-chain-fatty-acid--CoA ligase [Betaproteobacteria bacterium]